MTSLASQLGGAKRLVYVRQDHKQLLIPAVMALMLCDEHKGEHHFAVIQEGCGLAMSEAGLQCLIDQGITFENVSPE